MEELDREAFNAAFLAALKEAVKRAARESRDIDIDRIVVLQSVYERIKEILRASETNIIIQGLMASVDAVTERVSLDEKGLQELCGILEDCGTISILPRTDGRVNFSVSVRVFR